MKYVANPVEVDAEIIVGVGPMRSTGGLTVTLQSGNTFDCDKGMIARYIPRKGDYLVKQSDGYVYLNPKDVFERKYSTAGPSIGWALRQMRQGKRVARAGWNGKGMYLAYQRGYPEGIPINQNTADATGLPAGTVCRFLPYVMMRTAQGDFVPWLCSQTDLLATDWEVVG